MRRQAVLAVVFMALPLLLGAQEETPPSFDNPAIQDVLAMVDADLSEGLILARVDKIGAFPELTGPDLAALKRYGVPEPVLLRMIELGVPGDTPAAVEPAPEPLVAALPEEAAQIKVIVERPFRVTYYEVVVDDELVHTEGRIWEGSVEGGRHLKRPVAVRGKGPVTAYSSPVDPGSYSVVVGFAVSSVQGDPADEWGEYAGEEYVTRGIRATDDVLPGGKPSGNPGARCELNAGEICEVTATFASTSPSALGGLPRYSVQYRTEVLEPG